MENPTAFTPAPRPRFNNVGVSMVKNEEDIIEAFVRYNLKFLDYLLVVDNGSSDNTLLILKNLQAEGLPLEVAAEGSQAFLQAEVMTAGYHSLARRFDFTRIFFLDADEFLLGDPAVLNQTAAEPGTIARLTEILYVPRRMVDADKNVFKNMCFQHPNTAPKPQNKVVFFHDPGRFLEYRLGNGNHNVWFKGERLSGGRFPLSLGHCAFRSREQLFSKVVMGTLGLLMRSPDDKATGCHWHMNFEKLMDADFSMTEDELYRHFLGTPREALLEKCRYIPLEPVKLRYLDLIGGRSLLKNVLTSYKVTIEKYWEEKARIPEYSPAAAQ